MTGAAEMPAKSQAQRAYLNAHFGHAWVKEHHFDNTGKLPAHAGGKRRKPTVKKHKGKGKGKKTGTRGIAKVKATARTYFKGTNEAMYGCKSCK